jgi:hypothetical protein
MPEGFRGFHPSLHSSRHSCLNVFSPGPFISKWGNCVSDTSACRLTSEFPNLSVVYTRLSIASEEPPSISPSSIEQERRPLFSHTNIYMRTLKPGAVIWKNLRPDHRQAMLGDFKYYDTPDRILDGREIHGFFRQPQLIKMLVSMMYWWRLDSTPWSKYVPETFYEMADKRLDRLLTRGDVPPSWEAPDEHIAYPDEDVDSTVDDTNADPDFKPREHAVSDGSVSLSSEEESDEAEFADPASTKSASKRGRSSSDDDSDAPLVATVNAKRQKSGSGSARPSSGRQGSGRSQTPS